METPLAQLIPGQIAVLETKYRDIADGNRAASLCFSYSLHVVGNQVPRYSGWKPFGSWGGAVGCQALETKYRDIADGNKVSAMTSRCSRCVLETKYRDIADGNPTG